MSRRLARPSSPRAGRLRRSRRSMAAAVAALAVPALITATAGTATGTAVGGTATPGAAHGGTATAGTAGQRHVGSGRALGTPTRLARDAGINRVGQAYLGWHDRHLALRAKVRDGRVEMTPMLTGAVYGLDVSHWQGSVNWSSWYSKGKRFAYIKATEGTSFRDPAFSTNYTASARAGLVRGGYHFALPNKSSGATQADYFVAHGGDWSRDGKTLPGVLDIEYNPYGSTCYGMSQSSLKSWIASFVSEYHRQTGRDAVIYTAYNFWVPCVNSSSFSSTNPLWIANYQTLNPTLFGGWGFKTFQQYTDSPLDLDLFNGDSSRLRAMVNG